MQFAGNGFSLVGITSIAWLVALTFFVVRLARHYRRLTQGATKTGLMDILEKILGSQEETRKKFRDTDIVLRHLVGEGKRHISRIGVVRFNPFRDTGGSQSFTVALLNEEDDGIVMTSLYARSGNRWYVKEVRAGKGRDLVLSGEEEAAIKNAKHSVVRQTRS